MLLVTMPLKTVAMKSMLAHLFSFFNVSMCKRLNVLFCINTVITAFVLLIINYQDLVSALKSELGGLFESLIVALMTPSVSYDASQLHKALKVTDENFLGRST